MGAFKYARFSARRKRERKADGERTNVEKSTCDTSLKNDDDYATDLEKKCLIRRSRCPNRTFAKYAERSRAVRHRVNPVRLVSFILFWVGWSRLIKLHSSLKIHMLEAKRTIQNKNLANPKYSVLNRKINSII